MKNKKALIVIIVLLVILAVCGGAFACIFCNRFTKKQFTNVFEIWNRVRYGII